MASKPLISLITDFGYASPYVGILKVVILCRCPDAKIIDLFHNVAAYNVDEAGFFLAKTFATLPAKTIHVAVVDPSVGSSRQILAARHNKHLFLAPDNGLLDQAFGEVNSIEFRALDIAALTKRLRLEEISNTFHGRDIFAPVAAALAAGDCSFEDLGPVQEDIAVSTLGQARQQNNIVHGVVISIDHYGNLITNISAEHLAENAFSRLICVGQRFPVIRTYANSQKNDCIALINSFNVLEIACVQGHAADTLGIARGEKVELHLRKH